MTLRLDRLPAALALLVALAGTLSAGRLSAQDSTAAAPAPARADTAPPTPATLVQRTSPMGAMFRSLVLPGWGQARLNRKVTAGVFIAWEGVTLGMSLKTGHELAYLRRTNSARADDKHLEHEDWLVLLGFNHVLAALEAYVSAHLAEFPPDLKLQAVPRGFGGTVPLPFRIR